MRSNYDDFNELREIADMLQASCKRDRASTISGLEITYKRPTSLSCDLVIQRPGFDFTWSMNGREVGFEAFFHGMDVAMRQGRKTVSF